jgi:serine/threonine protein kinase
MSAQVLSGIAHCHRQGIFHRDMKPDNVLCLGLRSNMPQFKIGDFGHAIKHGSWSGSYGTPQYLAPELLRRIPDPFTDKCDVYAFGVTLFEVIAGNGQEMCERIRDLTDPDREWWGGASHSRADNAALQFGTSCRGYAHCNHMIGSRRRKH